jgi:hypothetical protein
MKIHCIGDSHISLFSGEHRIIGYNVLVKNREFYTVHVGPYTAFNAHKKEKIKNLCDKIPKNEHLLFSFGEIDTRCRVHLSEDKIKNINLISDNYFKLINRVKHKVIVLGVTPCLFEEPMKDFPERMDIRTLTKGTLEERNFYKKTFNDIVEKRCKKEDHIFIDYWDFCKEKENLYLDDIHLSGKEVIETIRELIINKI